MAQLGLCRKSHSTAQPVRGFLCPPQALTVEANSLMLSFPLACNALILAQQLIFNGVWKDFLFMSSLLLQACLLSIYFCSSYLLNNCISCS